MEAILSTTRNEQERVGKIRTFTGRYVNPLAMAPGDLDIRDIAHHLALECRFAGAIPQHYSVAQHSEDVSCRVALKGKELALAGLLHDAAEAYMKDLPSPVKKAPEMEFYRRKEHELTEMIFCAFGLDPQLLAEIKPYDDAAFADEAQAMWGTGPRIAPWTWQYAEFRFLSRYEYLTEGRVK